MVDKWQHYHHNVNHRLCVIGQTDVAALAPPLLFDGSPGARPTVTPTSAEVSTAHHQGLAARDGRRDPSRVAGRPPRPAAQQFTAARLRPRNRGIGRTAPRLLPPPFGWLWGARKRLQNNAFLCCSGPLRVPRDRPDMFAAASPDGVRSCGRGRARGASVGLRLSYPPPPPPIWAGASSQRQDSPTGGRTFTEGRHRGLDARRRV